MGEASGTENNEEMDTIFARDDVDMKTESVGKTEQRIELFIIKEEPAFFSQASNDSSRTTEQICKPFIFSNSVVRAADMVKNIFQGLPSLIK